MTAMEIEIEQSLYVKGEEVESHRVRIPNADFKTNMLNNGFDSAREALDKFRTTVETYIDAERPF